MSDHRDPRIVRFEQRVRQLKAINQRFFVCGMLDISLSLGRATALAEQAQKAAD
jgi:hypothetical protein